LGATDKIYKCVIQISNTNHNKNSLHKGYVSVLSPAIWHQHHNFTYIHRVSQKATLNSWQ